MGENLTYWDGYYTCKILPMKSGMGNDSLKTKTKKMKSILKLLLICGVISMVGCGDFLEEKPQKSLVIPNSLDDFQAILDAEPRFMNSLGSFALIGSDDMVMTPNLLSIVPPQMQAVYLWEEEVFTQLESVDDWNIPYQMIYNANVVLEGLSEYELKNESDRIRSMELEGSAKFSRAFGHFSLMQLFSPPFSSAEPSQPGIPIRVSADINVATGLSTASEVYELILSDLEFARENLPDKPELLTRPSAWASESLLSRVYMVLQNYKKAFEHADAALKIGNSLMDYNTLSKGNGYVFPRFNPEVIFHVNVISTRLTSNSGLLVNPDLYRLYDSLDQRKELLFEEATHEGFYNLISRYSGDFYDFSGLAVDEVLLNHAEAAARLGMESIALEDLNRLMKNRIRAGYFKEQYFTGAALMKRILEERRKELLFRGIRWMDLRRLNQENAYAVTLEREYNEGNAMLEPNGKGYTIPIPPLESQLNPSL